MIVESHQGIIQGKAGVRWLATVLPLAALMTKILVLCTKAEVAPEEGIHTQKQKYVPRRMCMMPGLTESEHRQRV